MEPWSQRVSKSMCKTKFYVLGIRRLKKNSVFVFDEQTCELTLVFGVWQYCFNLNFEVYKVFRHFNPGLNILKHLRLRLHKYTH